MWLYEVDVQNTKDSEYCYLPVIIKIPESTELSKQWVLKLDETSPLFLYKEEITARTHQKRAYQSLRCS